MNNNKFILSPVTHILEESVQATKNISMGIETYPLCEYLMQSLFLKMTGFQEQKLKCVCWEMASYDYDYRYELLKDGLQGECSDYKSKNKIINKLLSLILKDDSAFELFNEDKSKIILDSRNGIITVFSDSNIFLMNEKQFNFFIDKKPFEPNEILSKEHRSQKEYKLFNDSLKKEYEEKLYRFRNRCAHNLLSYQQNLPVFEKLLDDETGNNYFIWFEMLVIIDKIIILFFEKYLSIKMDIV